MSDNSMVKNRPGTHSPESTRNGFYYQPRVDIYETDGELTLYADLPGCDPQGVDLRYERGELTLKAKAVRPDRTGQPLLGEYGVGDYFRVFQVHESIDASRIEAEYKNGVLVVHLPKPEQVKPKQVTIKAQ